MYVCRYRHMERSATSKRPLGAYTDQLLWSASRSPHCRPNGCPRPASSPCYNTCAIAHGQVATSVCESPTDPESGREGRDNNALLAGVLIAICHTPPTVHRCLQTELQHSTQIHATYDIQYRQGGRPPQQPVNTISRIVRDRSTGKRSPSTHIW